MIAGTLEIQMLTNLAKLQSDMDAAKQSVGSAMGAIDSAIGMAQKTLMGFAAGMSVNMFAGMIQGSIEAQAELARMSARTGAAVESLSALKGVAKRTQTDFEDVGGGVQKLAKSMVAAESGAGKQAEAFAMLGISSKELAAHMNDPAQMMLVVAQHMGEFEEGARKDDIAMALMGKSGSNLLPMMGELGKQTELVGKLTTQQALEAEKFVRLQGQWAAKWKEIYSTIATAILPVMNEFFGAMVKGGGIAKTLTDYVKGLSASGQLQEWARTAKDGLDLLFSAIGPALKITAAYFALFTVGPAIFAAVTAAVVPLFNAVMLYAAEVAIGQAATIGWNTALFGTSVAADLASGSLSKMKLAGSVLMAAFAGWEIGTLLHDRFVTVRVAGLEMVSLLLEGVEYLQLGWDSAVNGMASLWYGFIKTLGDTLQNIPGFATAGKILSDQSAIALASVAKDQASAKAAFDGNLKSINDNVNGLKAWEYANDKAGKGIVLHTEEVKKGTKVLAAFDSAGAAARDKIAEVIGKLADEIYMLKLSAAAAEIYKKQKEAGVKSDSEAGKAIALLVTQYRDEKAVIDAATAAQTDAEKAMEALTAANVKEVVAISDAIEKENLRIETLGMSRAAVEELKLAKMGAALQAQLDGPREEKEIAHFQELIKWQRQYIDTVARGDVADANKKAAEDSAAWWKKASEQIETSLTDALVKGFGNGKDLVTSLRDYIVHGFESMVVRIAVQPVMGALGGMLGMGSAVAGVPGAEGGGGGGGLGSVVSGAGMLANMGGAFGAGASWLTGGSLLGNLGAGASLVGTGSMAGITSGLSMLAGAVGPIAIAAVLLAKAMEYKITPNGNALTATVGSKGLVNGSVGTRADFTQEGGFLGGGTTHNSSWGVADAGTTGYIDTAVKTVTAANAAYAQVLGLSATALDGFTKQLDINVTGMDAAAAQAAINAEVTKFGVEQVTAAYGLAIGQFSHDGETMVQTLQRLAQMQVASVALNELGGVFSRIATLGIAGRDSMIQLAGGIDALLKKSSDFVKDYYSQSEQSGLAAKGVLAQLNAAGIQDAGALQTREQYRALVEAMDVSTKAGREQLNVLLTLAPQFAQLTDTLKTQGGDLGTLAQMAPHVAALDPMFSATKDAATASASAADATNASINATKDAVSSGTTAVVTAVKDMAATVASAVRDGMAAAGASNAQVAKALDNIDSANRLALAGGGA